MQIHLIRNAADPTRDDIITIRSRMNGDYLVRYVDGTLPRSVWVNSKSENDLLDYIENILKFFQRDYDPFISIQITLPGWPLIFLQQKDVDDDMITRIMDSIELHLQANGRPFSQ